MGVTKIDPPIHYMCWGPNSHFSHIGDGHQPNSMVFIPNIRIPYWKWDDHSPYNATSDPGTYVKVSSWLNKHFFILCCLGVEGQKHSTSNLTRRCLDFLLSLVAQAPRWWATVDGSEIRGSPVDVVNIPLISQCLYAFLGGFLPDFWTVNNIMGI